MWNRVQVGCYSGDPDADTSCPNCGDREDAAHLCQCPDEDRTRLLCENVDDLEEWLNKGGKTDPHLAYWIPRYIKYRGVRRFQDMDFLPEHLKPLAESQDLIGYRHFMEGRVSKLFWQIQSVHLACSEGHLNGTEWTKGLISRILTITHSQWIYRNVSYHDKQSGYAKRTKIEELNHKILQLSQTSPREVPQDCLFLLERDDSGHEDETVQAKGYYVAAMEAAIKQAEEWLRWVGGQGSQGRESEGFSGEVRDWGSFVWIRK